MKDLGLEINLSKSIVSPNGTAFEFAKRVFIQGQDVTPISLTEYSAAIQSVASLFSFVRKYSIPDHVASRLLGLGYRNTWKSIRWRWYQFYKFIPTDFDTWIHYIGLIYQDRKSKVVPSVLLNDVRAFILGELKSLQKRYSAFISDIHSGFKECIPLKGVTTPIPSGEFCKGQYGPQYYYNFLYELFSNISKPAVEAANLELADIDLNIRLLERKGVISKLLGALFDRFNLLIAIRVLLDTHKVIHSLPVNFLYQKSVSRKSNKPLNVFQMMVKMFNSYRFISKINRNIKLK